MTRGVTLKVRNATTPGVHRVMPLQPRVPEDRKAHGLKGALSGVLAESRFLARSRASFEQRAKLVIFDFDLPTLTCSAGYSRSWLFSTRDSMLAVLRLVKKTPNHLLKRETVQQAIASFKRHNLLLDVELTDRMAAQVKKSSSLVADESLRRHLPSTVVTL
jgi:hypothetical protein